MIDGVAPRRRLHHGRQRDHAERHEAENLRALVEATHEFGGYDAPDVVPEPLRVAPATIITTAGVPAMTGHQPGVCVSWEERRAELAGPIQGSEELARRVWEAADASGAMFIWQMLVSF